MAGSTDTRPSLIRARQVSTHGLRSHTAACKNGTTTMSADSLNTTPGPRRAGFPERTLPCRIRCAAGTARWPCCTITWPRDRRVDGTPVHRGPAGWRSRRCRHSGCAARPRRGTPPSARCSRLLLRRVRGPGLATSMAGGSVAGLTRSCDSLAEAAERPGPGGGRGKEPHERVRSGTGTTGHSALDRTGRYSHGRHHHR